MFQQTLPAEHRTGVSPFTDTQLAVLAEAGIAVCEANQWCEAFRTAASMPRAATQPPQLRGVPLGFHKPVGNKKRGEPNPTNETVTAILNLHKAGVTPKQFNALHRSRTVVPHTFAALTHTLTPRPETAPAVEAATHEFAQWFEKAVRPQWEVTTATYNTISTVTFRVPAPPGGYGTVQRWVEVRFTHDPTRDRDVSVRFTTAGWLHALPTSDGFDVATRDLTGEPDLVAFAERISGWVAAEAALRDARGREKREWASFSFASFAAIDTLPLPDY